jgi:uncharacterized DUF497 family protein
MGLVFEWDAEKALGNQEKHGVSFEEAASAFADPLSLTIADPEHSVGEERWILLGLSFTGRLVVAAHTERQDTIRLISARPATRSERRQYEGTS